MAVCTRAAAVPSRCGSKEAKVAHLRMPPSEHRKPRRKERLHKTSDSVMTVVKNAQEKVEGDHRANLDFSMLCA